MPNASVDTISTVPKTKNYKIVASLVVALMLWSQADAVEVQSPDGNIVVGVSLTGDGKPQYSIRYRDYFSATAHKIFYFI